VSCGVGCETDASPLRRIGTRAMHARRTLLDLHISKRNSPDGNVRSFFALSLSLSLSFSIFPVSAWPFDHHRARSAAAFVTFKPAVGRGSLVSGPCHVEKSMQPGVFNNVAVTAHYADTMSISNYDVDSLRALRQSCRPSSSCSDPFGQKFAIRACRAPAVRPRAFCARVSPFATSDDSRGYASSGETELTPVHVRDDRVG